MLRVSVVMTTFNCINTIKSSVKSFFKQSISSKELICVDGGSTDGTYEFLLELAKKFDNVRVYKQKTKGIGGAKNEGIEQASGKYLAFLDADDFYYSRNSLEDLFKVTEKHLANLCGSFRKVLKDGVLTDHPMFRDKKRGKTEFYINYEQYQCDYHFHSYLYRTDFLKKNQLRFADSSAFDDCFFLTNTLLLEKKILIAPVEFYCYRIHEDYDWEDNKLIDAVNMLNYQLNFSKEKGLCHLHLLTLGRLNYEYSYLIERAVRRGNIKVLDLLINAEGIVSKNLILEALNNTDSFKNNYWLSMLPEIQYVENEFKNIVKQKKYIKILNNLFEEISKPERLQLMNLEKDKQKTIRTQSELRSIKNSLSFKIGRAITFVPRVLRDLFRL